MKIKPEKKYTVKIYDLYNQPTGETYPEKMTLAEMYQANWCDRFGGYAMPRTDYFEEEKSTFFPDRDIVNAIAEVTGIGVELYDGDFQGIIHDAEEIARDMEIEYQQKVRQNGGHSPVTLARMNEYYPIKQYDTFGLPTGKETGEVFNVDHLLILVDNAPYWHSCVYKEGNVFYSATDVIYTLCYWYGVNYKPNLSETLDELNEITYEIGKKVSHLRRSNYFIWNNCQNWEELEIVGPLYAAGKTDKEILYAVDYYDDGYARETYEMEIEDFLSWIRESYEELAHYKELEDLIK
jgi:hypothetical protein